MTTVLMRAPAGAQGQVQLPGGQAVIQTATDGSASVDASLVPQLIKAGWTFFFADTNTCYFAAPIAAELITIVAATIPVSGAAYTIAAQPGFPRKLQVRCVQSGAVASLVVNIVGTDGRGNAVSESVNVAGASTATFATVNAYAHVMSVTPVGTVTNVTTIGVGVGAALALQLPPNFSDLLVYKENLNGADEAVGTVDAVAGTVSPTTAPDGTRSFQFFYSYNRASQ